MAVGSSPDGYLRPDQFLDHLTVITNMALVNKLSSVEKAQWWWTSVSLRWALRGLTRIIWERWTPFFNLNYLNQFLSMYCKVSFHLIVTRPWRVPATRPDPNFFCYPNTDPNYFSKFPSLGFSQAGSFPAGCFKSFNNNPQILMFLANLTWNLLLVE